MDTMGDADANDEGKAFLPGGIVLLIASSSRNDRGTPHRCKRRAEGEFKARDPLSDCYARWSLWFIR
jgi:hypothetical protein